MARQVPLQEAPLPGQGESFQIEGNSSKNLKILLRARWDLCEQLTSKFL